MQENIKIKIAISLRTLLEKVKWSPNKHGKDVDIGDSHNTIGLNAGIRKATVTDIFNAVSCPNSSTLILIIEAMGFKSGDFSEIYDSLTEAEIKDFKARNNKKVTN